MQGSGTLVRLSLRIAIYFAAFLGMMLIELGLQNLDISRCAVDRDITACVQDHRSWSRAVGQALVVAILLIPLLWRGFKTPDRHRAPMVSEHLLEKSSKLKYFRVLSRLAFVSSILLAVSGSAFVGSYFHNTQMANTAGVAAVLAGVVLMVSFPWSIWIARRYGMTDNESDQTKPG
jgi:uncharacterized membrane protein YedE/YeeE